MRPHGDTSLPNLITALEGSNDLVSFVNRPDSCPCSNYCASRDLSRLLSAAIVGAVSPITLESIAKWQAPKLDGSQC